TVGEERFKEADALLRQGKTNEAIAAFEKLRGEYRQTWIDRVSQERLARLDAVQEPRRRRREEAESETDRLVPPRYLGGDTNGITAKYPADARILRDPRVLVVDNFVCSNNEEIGKRWGEIRKKDGKMIAFRCDEPAA